MSTWTQPALIEESGLHPLKAAALARRIEPGWQHQAACAGQAELDPDAWFPHRGATRQELTPVLAVCADCPVRRSCLAAGLLGKEYGIWGGTTETERRCAQTALSSAKSRIETVLTDLLDAPVPATEAVA